jgi:chloramphenicol 3-O phosphotransferase
VFDARRRHFSLTKLIDIKSAYSNTQLMPGDMIILNGPSSAGKSSLVKELQQLWPHPLFATGTDAVITGWPDNFVLDHDESDPAKELEALRIVAGQGPAPSWVPKMSDTFLTISRHAHESWAAMSQSGVDVVVDHCIIEPSIREHAQNVLLGAFWVGVTCDVQELVRREAARGDRYVGFASGTSAIVHLGMDYDMVIDTTSTPPEELARQVFDAVRCR